MAQKLPKFISEEEFKKILAKEKDKRFKLAYSLAFGSGLRISEIVGLRKWISKCCSSDIIKRRIKIDDKFFLKSFCIKCEKELTAKEITRSKTEWEIEPLTLEQINLQEHQIKLFGKGGKERITVTSPLLNPENVKFLPLNINRRTLQRRFSVLCEKVLGKHFNFHCLRHGFANFMVNEKNVPLPMVQSMLGHSRLDTTGIYTRANPKKAIETAWESF